MTATTEYVSTLEIARRIGWTVPQTQEWATERGLCHPKYGWLVERGRAEELMAARGGDA